MFNHSPNLNQQPTNQTSSRSDQVRQIQRNLEFHVNFDNIELSYQKQRIMCKQATGEGLLDMGDSVQDHEDLASFSPSIACFSEESQEEDEDSSQSQNSIAEFDEENVRPSLPQRCNRSPWMDVERQHASRCFTQILHSQNGELRTTQLVRLPQNPLTSFEGICIPPKEPVCEQTSKPLPRKTHLKRVDDLIDRSWDAVERTVLCHPERVKATKQRLLSLERTVAKRPQGQFVISDAFKSSEESDSQ